MVISCGLPVFNLVVYPKWDVVQNSPNYIQSFYTSVMYWIPCLCSMHDVL
jgi:hypothetical protein